MLIKGIHEHRPTFCWTSPTAYRAMLGMLGQHDISSLRKCVSAGEHLPRATFEAWEQATGIRIIDGIGATEMLHIFISASGDDIRPGSTGRVVPGYEARCVDSNGVEVPRGEIGRLAVRGPTGCRYLGDLDRQRGYVENGWNVTGDSFRQDDGRLLLVRGAHGRHDHHRRAQRVRRGGRERVCSSTARCRSAASSLRLTRSEVTS